MMTYDSKWDKRAELINIQENLSLIINCTYSIIYFNFTLYSKET